MKFRHLILFFAAIFLASCGKDEPTPDPGPGGDGDPIVNPIFSFAPNQLAGNAWYRQFVGWTTTGVINGHLDESYGVADNWPQLRERLKECGGHFGLYAAEIGFLDTRTGLLPLLKENNIPISVEIPGFTQFRNATALAQAELNGQPIGAENIFSSIFTIHGDALTGRTNPDTKGWFVTRDRKDLVPDLIFFDERMPNLIPEIDHNILANTANGTFQQRLDAARKFAGSAEYRIAYPNLLELIKQDYVDYLTVAKAKWGDDMPGIGIHWNVNVGWEWRNQDAIKAIEAGNPGRFDNAGNFHSSYKLNNYQYAFRSVGYLTELIDKLTDAGFKPEIISMDVDWNYDLNYVVRILKLHKAALAAQGVHLGINVVDASFDDARKNSVLTYNGLSASWVASSGGPNLCYQKTLLNILQFLKDQGVYEKGMQIRTASWLPVPTETGNECSEDVRGSFAETSIKIYDKL